MRVRHLEPELENHDRGLDYDLPRLARRGMLGLIAGASLATVVGCASAEPPAEQPSRQGAPPDGNPPGGGPGGGGPGGGGVSNREVSDGEVPEETAGPYPGDGSNGPNILDDSGIVRSDITSSFGTSTTTAGGIPLTFTMTILSHDDGDAPLAGAAVYAWHCDREGRYSLYSSGVENENYLRGVQETDANGSVTFTSIFPACYSGRWPHIHFEVYPSLAKATSSDTKLATSQMALPEDTVNEAYATPGYEQSVTNLARVTLASDNIFSDGYDLQLPEVTGDAGNGYQLTFSCSI